MDNKSNAARSQKIPQYALTVFVDWVIQVDVMATLGPSLQPVSLCSELTLMSLGPLAAPLCHHDL